jgi:hypothetical protein
MKPETVQFDGLTIWPGDEHQAEVQMKFFQDELPAGEQVFYGRLGLTAEDAKHVIGLLQAILDGKEIA